MEEPTKHTEASSPRLNAAKHLESALHQVAANMNHTKNIAVVQALRLLQQRVADLEGAAASRHGCEDALAAKVRTPGPAGNFGAQPPDLSLATAGVLHRLWDDRAELMQEKLLLAARADIDTKFEVLRQRLEGCGADASWGGGSGGQSSPRSPPAARPPATLHALGQGLESHQRAIDELAERQGRFEAVEARLEQQLRRFAAETHTQLRESEPPAPDATARHLGARLAQAADGAGGGGGAAGSAAASATLEEMREVLAAGSRREQYGADTDPVLVARLEEMGAMLSRQREHMVQSRLRQIVFRMTHDRVGACFEGWSALVARKRRVAHVQHRAAMRLQNRLLSGCFYQWGREIRAGHDALIAEMVQMHAERVDHVEALHGSALEEMGQMLARQRRHVLHSKLRQIIFKMAHDCLGTCFEAWVGWWARNKRAANVLQKAAMRLQHRLLSTALLQWATTIGEQKATLVADIMRMQSESLGEIQHMLLRQRDHRVRSEVQKVVFLLYYNLLRVSFAGWLTQTRRQTGYFVDAPR